MFQVIEAMAKLQSDSIWRLAISQAAAGHSLAPGWASLASLDSGDEPPRHEHDPSQKCVFVLCLAGNQKSLH